MKNLVLGANGFIGKNLISKLDYFEGVSVRVAGWENLIVNSDTIINLVGKAHNHNGTATEEDYRHVNTVLAKQIYNAFVSSDAKLLIHISSLAALEEFESSNPLKESDLSSPVSFYGKTKREAEEWLIKQDLPVGKKLIILRPPMVHGPGDKGNLGLLYKFISKGIPYPLSSFDNKRSFISIDNFCYFIEQIIEGQEKMESGIYHIADDEPISTKEIIAIMKNVTNKNVRNVALPKAFVKTIAKIGDKIPILLNSNRLKKMTSDLLVSNKKIKTALGIEKLPLTAKEGLEKTIRSFKER